MSRVAVCFVCLGNICRSPTAAGLMRQLITERGLERTIEVDSAGTGSWHVGEPPDDRAREEAARRGVVLDDVGRQFERDDFDRFDLVVAMDHDNRSALHRLAAHEGHRAKIRLLREFDPDAPAGAPVPDPYYGGEDGFRDVFDLVETACSALLDHLVEAHDLEPS